MLTRLLRHIEANDLSKLDFPFSNFQVYEEPYQQVIVFIVGGATYEEAMEASLFAQKTGISVILGGNTIHNSKT